MSTQPPEPKAPPTATFKYNEKLGTGNGWAVSMGDGFFSPSVVVAGFAAKLGAPNWVIGLLPALYSGGWNLPQLLVAARVRSLPYKLPVYRSAAFIRTVSYLSIVLVTAFLAHQPVLCLSLLVLCMLINSLASGVSGLPFFEVVSKTIPTQQRPRFFAVRNLYGGLLAFGAGLFVRWILASDLAFPFNYALIFTLATLAFTFGYWLFGKVDEPADQPQPPSSLKEEILAIPQTLQDPAVRTFFYVRLLLAGATMSEPFFVANALRNLQFPGEVLGSFVMAVTFVAPFSNIVWQRLAERRGSRRILQAAAFAFGLAPLWAIAVGYWHLDQWAYLLVFILTSVATQGFFLGYSNHLLNICPTESRSRYIGTLNTLVGFAQFTPVLGGFIADRFNYTPVFILSTFFAGLAVWQCNKLQRDA